VNTATQKTTSLSQEKNSFWSRNLLHGRNEIFSWLRSLFRWIIPVVLI